MTVRECINDHKFDIDTYPVCPVCGKEPILSTEKSGNIKVCKKGHKYDKSSYSKCPICARGKHRSGRAKNSAPALTPSAVWDAAQESPKDLPEGSVSQPANQSANQPVIQPAADAAPRSSKTFSIFSDENARLNTPHTDSFWEKPKRGGDQALPATPEKPVFVPTVEAKEPDIVSAGVSNGSLMDEVIKASANSEGKSIGYFQSRSSANKSAEQLISEPVVGWLVCLSGEHIGRSFEIFSGNNSIGRGSENRIILDKDMSVSREKHSVLTYEPIQRRFYIRPGDGNGLTYLDKEFLKQMEEIKAGSVITVGQSDLLLVPLCCETFSWETYITKS